MLTLRVARGRYNSVDVSVAVATDKGLLTPIIKNAHQKGLATIAKEIRVRAPSYRAAAAATLTRDSHEASPCLALRLAYFFPSFFRSWRRELARAS